MSLEEKLVELMFMKTTKSSSIFILRHTWTTQVGATMRICLLFIQTILISTQGFLSAFSD